MGTSNAIRAHLLPCEVSQIDELTGIRRPIPRPDHSFCSRKAGFSIADAFSNRSLNPGIDAFPTILPEAPLPSSDSIAGSTGLARFYGPRFDDDSQARVSTPVGRTVGERNSSVFHQYALDQRDIWTSPLSLRPRDFVWLAPSAAILGETLHRDQYMSSRLRTSPTGGTMSRTISGAGVLALGGLSAAFWLQGRFGGDAHNREAGRLSALAVADALTVSNVLKYSLGRERPFQGSNRGLFAEGRDSFPSDHATAAWAMAAVLAREYPGPKMFLGAYGLAVATSLARVSAQKHFVSDVLVGSALGYAIGAYVYRSHHRDEVGGKFSHDEAESDSTTRKPVGSVYMPLDSWVYPDLERLAALGYIDSQFSGLRPWTRQECVRQLEEAEAALDNGDRIDPEATQILRGLKEEFQADQQATYHPSYRDVRVESLYSRFQGVNGPPLLDDLNFGRTVVNDFGRPLAEGANFISGFSARAAWGRLAFYVRGEYQFADDSPPVPLAARSFLAFHNGTPLQPGVPIPGGNRVRFLDAYGVLNLDQWQISLGRQSLWWGPGETGGMMLSDNVEPPFMLRLSRTMPAEIPGVSRLLGPFRFEYFITQLAGHQFVTVSSGTFVAPLSRQPFLQGAKLMFKPTPNFEFGVALTSVFGGPGFPITTRTFLRSLGLSNTFPGLSDDPGDRRTGFDFRYRVPGLRRWLTFYNDSLAEDEYNPIGYPRRSAMNPGLLLSRFPWAPRLDLRVEGYYTDLPGLRAPGFFYFNSRYQSGYTQRGRVLGNATVGRQGKGWNSILRYHIADQRTLQFSYKTNIIDPGFIPEGGRINQFASQIDWKIDPRWTVGGRIQVESWRIPLLASGSQINVLSSFTVRFSPPRPGWFNSSVDGKK